MHHNEVTSLHTMNKVKFKRMREKRGETLYKVGVSNRWRCFIPSPCGRKKEQCGKKAAFGTRVEHYTNYDGWGKKRDQKSRLEAWAYTSLVRWYARKCVRMLEKEVSRTLAFSPFIYTTTQQVVVEPLSLSFSLL